MGKKKGAKGKKGRRDDDWSDDDDIVDPIKAAEEAAKSGGKGVQNAGKAATDKPNHKKDTKDEEEESEEGSDAESGGAVGGGGASNAFAMLDLGDDDDDDDDEEVEENNDNSEEVLEEDDADSDDTNDNRKKGGKFNNKPNRPLTAKEKKRQKQMEKREKAKGKMAETSDDDDQVKVAALDEEQSDGGEVDIKIENFSLTVPGRTLLKDTTLTLANGIRYGLAGPNGCGKSTLLRAIAARENEFKRIPKNISILHVEQEVVGDDTTALDSVMSSDTELVSLLAEKRRLEAQEDADGERLGKVYELLAELGSDSAEARASRILIGLQFFQSDFHRATKEFSGGWRMRLALAAALYCRPDLLLLDEPSNHLDLYAVIWLEQYLQTWRNTLLVVSHDRGFLNNVVQQTICIYNDRLYYYKGNYDSFDTNHRRYIATQRKALEKQRKKLDALKKQLSDQQQSTSATSKKGKGKGKAGGKDKGGGGGAARQTKAAGASVGQKAKLIEKIEAAGLVEELPQDYAVNFDFPDPPDIGHPCIQVKMASFGYDADKPLFKNVDAGIDMHSKIALVGANGSGKSTLMKVLMGELKPTKGEVVLQRKLMIGHFNQHFVDQMDLKLSAVGHIDAMLKSKGVELKVGDIRAFLGRFGLTGKQHTMPLANLSGGQKSRVVMCELALRYPQVMFLDEPTNHLDIESVDALTEALQAFEGGVILVSHDSRLISEVCDTIWILNTDERRVDVWNGTFEEYREMLIEKHFGDIGDDDWEEELRRKQELKEKRAQLQAKAEERGGKGHKGKKK